MIETANGLTFDIALDRFTKAVSVMNIRDAEEEQNYFAHGQANAWEEVLNLMGHTVKYSMFIDENRIQTIPYVIIDGKRTDMMNPFLDFRNEEIKEEGETVSEATKEAPKRYSHKKKKEAYINFYRAVCPDRALDTTTKYDKVMDNVLNKFVKEERAYVIKRFGLDGNGTRTLQQIADEDGNISRSTVTKIINRILDTLKETENVELLEEALVPLNNMNEETPVESADEPEMEDIEGSDFMLELEDSLIEEDGNEEDNDPDFLDDPSEDLDESPEKEGDHFEMPF